MSQFNEVALQVYNLDHLIAMTAMKCGLKLCPFLLSLEEADDKLLRNVSQGGEMCTDKESYDAHGPPSTLMAPFALVVKERPLV